MFIPGKVCMRFDMPSGHATTLKKYIFFSSAPFSINTLTAHMAEPPVANIGSSNKILLPTRDGNLL